MNANALSEGLTSPRWSTAVAPGRASAPATTTRQPHEAGVSAVVTRGATRDVALVFTRGKPVPPFGVGTEGEWQIRGEGVAAVHLFLYFDGEVLYGSTAAGATSPSVDGAPLGAAWIELAATCDITFGAACITVADPSTAVLIGDSERAADPLSADTIAHSVLAPHAWHAARAPHPARARERGRDHAAFAVSDVELAGDPLDAPTLMFNRRVDPPPVEPRVDLSATIVRPIPSPAETIPRPIPSPAETIVRPIPSPVPREIAASAARASPVAVPPVVASTASVANAANAANAANVARAPEHDATPTEPSLVRLDARAARLRRGVALLALVAVVGAGAWARSRAVAARQMETQAASEAAAASSGASARAPSRAANGEPSVQSAPTAARGRAALPDVGGKSGERQAADAVASGAFEEAAARYATLAELTGDPVFRDAARIATRKARAR